MAMIKCPQCGKDISSRALKCPGCGLDLSHNIDMPATKLCIECGSVLDEDAAVCPNCGCPVDPDETGTDSNIDTVEVNAAIVAETHEGTASTENESAKPETVAEAGDETGSKKKRIILIGAAAAAVIIIIIIVIIASTASRKAKEEKALNQYISNYQNAAELMLDGAIDAEDACMLIHDVWYNTIFKESDSTTDPYTKTNGSFNDDFNDSLYALFMDTTFIAKKLDIQDNQEQVETAMQELVNPPEQYGEAYQELKDLYSSYEEFTNLALNPTGTLTTFTASYNDMDSEILADYNAVKLYFDADATAAAAAEDVKNSDFTQEQIDAVETYVMNAATEALKDYDIAVTSVDFDLSSRHVTEYSDTVFYDIMVNCVGSNVSNGEKIQVAEAIDEISGYDIEKATGVSADNTCLCVYADLGLGKLLAVDNSDGTYTLIEGNAIPVFSQTEEEIFGEAE